jgi:hypothetical protein
VLAVLSLLTGSTVHQIQLYASIWLVVVVLAAFVCYRELLGSTGLALLAVALLLVQPDFLFFILRGSHEKLTWLYFAVLLFLLARSYRIAHDQRRLAVHIGLFYLTMLGMVMTTAYFASTLFAALGLSFFVGWVLVAWRRSEEPQEDRRTRFLQRFLLASLACFVLVYAFTTYLYTPALRYYHTLGLLSDRLATLVLGAEPVVWPYEAVGSRWRYPWVYLVLISPQLTTAGLSFVAWLLRTRALIQEKWSAESRRKWLLWLVYAGFGIQLGLGILIDLSGFVGGNLQLRLFPVFAFIASPWAAQLLFTWYQRLSVNKRLVKVALAVLAVFSVTVSLLKVTNDPSVSNLWTFYFPAERDASLWTDKYVQESRVWLDTWDHQYDVLAFLKGYEWKPTNRYETGKADESQAAYFALSSSTRREAKLRSVPLPATIGLDRVYDNGEAQLYRRRPSIPDQR